MARANPLQGKGRDLSRYEDGGKYDLGRGLSQKQIGEAWSKVREFLWQHWSQRRMGHVTTTIYTEGDLTTTTFYIEPDEEGGWRVATEFQRECCWFHRLKRKDKTREYGAVVYDVVERVASSSEVKNGEVQIVWSVLPEGEERRPSTYALSLSVSPANQKGDSFVPRLIL